jgi:polyphosphate glucokinase
MEILGIDIGGSGIKGAPINVDSGELLAARFRLPTPHPSKPQLVAETVAQVARNFKWMERPNAMATIGCGFPAAIRNGRAITAANISKKWIGVDVASLFAKTTGCRVCVLNDADAAGLAEMTFGAGRGRQGVVMIVTVGTGLGTALFTNGQLVPNTELGHIELEGEDAELNASDAARERKNMSWKKWAQHFNLYLVAIEKLLWPDLIILGGGVSKKFEDFRPYLKVQAEILPAQFLNEAGIVGAALAARACVVGDANASS